MKFQEIDKEISNAFFRLESFMNYGMADYQYFGFNEAFTKLFNEAQKPENFTYANCKLIGNYWELTQQIAIDYDQSDYENLDAIENEMFCKDCEEISHLNWERVEEFTAFATTDEIAESERKFSITDILNAPALPPQQIETKTKRIETELSKYGFFELPKVEQLSESNKQNLVELISANNLPYIIAMVEYLGFLKHLKAEYFKTNYKLFGAVANCFECAERAVKGNIAVLNEFSNEDRTRYTAHLQKQKVQKDYEALK